MKQKNKTSNTQKLVLSGLFVALGIVLPFLTGKIPQLGRAFLPMHLPVLLAGFVVGPYWGGLVGLILPMLSHFIGGGMPPLDTAIPMTFELAAYGLIAGFLYSKLPKKPYRIVVALLGSMVGGRIVWGIAKLIYSRLLGASFTWELFAAGAVLNAIPGIIVQIILIPVIILALEKANLIRE